MRVVICTDAALGKDKSKDKDEDKLIINQFGKVETDTIQS